MIRNCIIVIILILSTQTLFGQEHIEQIKKHIELAEKSERGDQAIFHSLQAQNLIKEHDVTDPQILIELQHRFIRSFHIVKHKKNTIKHIKLLLQLIEKNDFYTEKSYIYNLGRVASEYMKMGELDSSLKYFRKAHLASLLGSNNIQTSSTLNNLGMLHEKKGNWQTAFQYYSIAIDVLKAKTEGDSIFQTSINDNISNYYLWKGDTIKSIQLLENNFFYLSNIGQRKSKANRFGLKLADLYLKRNEIIAAQTVLDRIKLDTLDIPYYFDHSISYFTLQLGVAERQNDLKSQLAFQNRLKELYASKLSWTNEQIISREKTISEYLINIAQRDIEIEKEKAIEAKKNSQYKTILILFLALIFIFISALIRLNYKRKLKAEAIETQLKEEQIKLKELENEKLNSDLHHQSNDFSDLVMQISLKEDWNKEVVMELKNLIKGNKTIESVKIKNIIRHLNQKSGLYDKVNLQQRGISEVNSAFFNRLDAKFPKLTKAERELCGLIRLRLDGKEIAIIRNIHPSSVRKLRHRLRKKLDLSLDVDVYDFINKI